MQDSLSPLPAPLAESLAALGTLQRDALTRYGQLANEQFQALTEADSAETLAARPWQLAQRLQHQWVEDAQALGAWGSQWQQAWFDALGEGASRTPAPRPAGEGPARATSRAAK
ncbi:phasin family protein [Halomonas salifodinae]|uniref:Phasin family protein n=1 Tax=Halomonas salifodinae TaxID=438745 RepID=A0ABW2EXA3_9GAMM